MTRAQQFVASVRVIEYVLLTSAGLMVHWLLDAGPLALLPVISVSSIALLTIVIGQALEAYSLAAFRAFSVGALKITTAWSLTFAVSLLLTPIVSSQIPSWEFVEYLFALGLTALILERVVVREATRRAERRALFARNTAIVGGGTEAETVIYLIDADPASNIRIVGIFDDRQDERSPKVVAGHHKLGTVDDLVTYARTNSLDMVIFTLPITAEERILHMLSKLWVLPIDIRLSAHGSRLRLRPSNYSYLGHLPVLDILERPISGWYLAAKWLVDKTFGGLLLLLLMPFMLSIALAIKLESPGPVLFRQKRYGFNNAMIEVLKFRTMYVDHADPDGVQQVSKGDPRVTPLGRFLRRTSLDELPQLLNVVFKGDLSLVGPRPHAPHSEAENERFEKVVEGYYARHKVKPGITGWAQVNGWRGETETREKIERRVEHDLYYIDNWSVLLDLYILARTPVALISGRNAY